MLFFGSTLMLSVISVPFVSCGRVSASSLSANSVAHGPAIPPGVVFLNPHDLQGRSADRYLIGGGVVVDLVGDVHAHDGARRVQRQLHRATQGSQPERERDDGLARKQPVSRSEEHTSELQSREK